MLGKSVDMDFIHSMAGFDACATLEWWRKWDVEDGMSRIRLEDSMFE